MYSELPDLAHWFKRKRGQPRKSALNRPTRRKIYLGVYTLSCLLFLALVWLPYSESWEATPNVMGGGLRGVPGSYVQQFGLLEFLQIEQTNVDVFTQQPLGYKKTESIWTWHPAQLTINILATIFIPTLCFAFYPITLRSERRTHNLCDECGYQLQGLTINATKCPECGTILDTYARTWITENQSAEDFHPKEPQT